MHDQLRVIPVKVFLVILCSLHASAFAESAFPHVPHKIQSTVGVQTASNESTSVQTVQAARAEYEFESGSLVKALRVDGQPILRAPIELNLSVNNEQYFLPDSLNLEENSTTTANVFSAQSDVSRDGYNLSSKMNLFDDGFLLVTLAIEPLASEEIRIDSLSIEIPLTEIAGSNLSRFLPYDFDNQRFERGSIVNISEQLSPNDTIQYPFSPVVAVESSSYGLEWMAETNSWHSLHDDDTSIRAVRTEEGVDLAIHLVDKPFTTSSKVIYQFSFFPIPSRFPSPDLNRTVIGSAGSTRTFAKAYREYENLDPVYFANWSRMPFEFAGLPNLSMGAEHASLIEEELGTLQNAGLGYMPYTAMHLMSSDIPEVIANVNEWRADDSRSSKWRNGDGTKTRVQPVAFDNPTLADFLISRHSAAVKETDIDVIYHDIAGANRLPLTQERAVLEYGLEEGSVYTPLFGQRDYARRYRSEITSASPDVKIAFHTGSYLPKSISTYADMVVFGESFHLFFKDNANDIEGLDYNPNYFDLPESMTEGTYSQKNGFRYVIIPQLVRKVDDISPEKETLDAQTDELLAFSTIHGYGVWGTKLSQRKFHEHLETLDVLNDEKMNRTTFEINLAQDEWPIGSKVIGRFDENQSVSVLSLYNYGPNPVNTTDIIDYFPEINISLHSDETGCSILLSEGDSSICTD